MAVITHPVPHCRRYISVTCIRDPLPDPMLLAYAQTPPQTPPLGSIVSKQRRRGSLSDVLTEALDRHFHESKSESKKPTAELRAVAMPSCRWQPKRSLLDVRYDLLVELGGVRADWDLQNVVTFPPQALARVQSFVRSFVPKVIQSQVDAGQARHIGEFRFVTVLMLKLVGVKYHEQETLNVIRAAVACVQNEVQKYDGTVMRIIHDDKGTRLLIAFGLPSQSHEDDSTRTILACLAMQPTLRGLGLKPAFGIASGHVFVGRSGSLTRCEYTTSGADVILAARLMDAAVDCILVDETTHGHSQHAVAFDDPTTIKVKNQAMPVTVYKATGEAKVANKPKSKTVRMIGRASEAALFTDAVNGLAAGQRGAQRDVLAPVLVFGEAGFGKTLLMENLVALCAERQVTCILVKPEEFASSDDLDVAKSLCTQLLRLECFHALGKDLETISEFFTDLSSEVETPSHVDMVFAGTEVLHSHRGILHRCCGQSHSTSSSGESL